MAISEAFQSTEEYEEALAIFEGIRNGRVSLAAFLRIVEHVYWKHKAATEEANILWHRANPDRMGR